jgi:UDP-2-acetamido-3-amino-2,3-dideoxy-glucuronate N-acetyltransferase
MKPDLIHPKALIEKGAKIGEYTRIWAFAHVMPKARIGSHCNIGDYVYIEGGARLGNGVTVKNGVQVWEGVLAEDDVFIGPGCTFTKHLTPRAFHKTPKRTWLRQTLLRKGCTLGAGSTILAGVSVGRYAFIAAGGLVTRDVPDFALAMGQPAVFHSWRCLCAKDLRFEGNRAQCSSCKSMFEMSKNGKQIRILKRARIFKHA